MDLTVELGDWEMSAFTCITCRVAFRDAELQRAHYKTDWHRYNLKRKVAELPPVTPENFQQRVLAQKTQVAESEKPTATRCNLCNKPFSSANSYDNHLQSKKHREAAAKVERKLQQEEEKKLEKGGDAELDTVAMKNAKNLALKESLTNVNQTVVEAPSAGASGRSRGQGQSAPGSTVKVQQVPMEDDDSDAESVESWEGDMIGLEECLFCSAVNSSLESNVEHMTKMHSFFIPDIEYLSNLEGLITYLGEKVGEGNVCLWCNEKGKSFYSTLAVQKHMRDKGHCKMLHEGDALFEYSDFYDYRSSYPDDQGEVEGEEAMEEGEQGEEDALESSEDSSQLVLPSGSTIGHRSLVRYYRQKLKPTRVLTYRPVNKIIAQYKALGWTGTSGAGAARRAKDIAHIQRMKMRHFNKMGIKNNKFQTYFRPQVIF